MKQHPKYDHLFLTEDGQVYSSKSNKYLSLYTHKLGYTVFSTRLNGRGSSAICLKVHRLVAETYLDNPNGLPQVNHIDGVKSNNCVSNLEWVSVSDNVKHAYKLGLASQKGIKNACFRHSDDDVELAKLYRVDGLSYREIAKLFNVSHSVIQRWVTW